MNAKAELEYEIGAPTSEQLRLKRLLNGWSQEEAALKFGVTKRTWQNWEAGMIPRQKHWTDLWDWVGGDEQRVPTSARKAITEKFAPDEKSLLTPVTDGEKFGDVVGVMLALRGSRRKKLDNPVAATFWFEAWEKAVLREVARQMGCSMNDVLRLLVQGLSKVPPQEFRSK